MSKMWGMVDVVKSADHGALPRAKAFAKAQIHRIERREAAASIRKVIGAAFDEASGALARAREACDEAREALAKAQAADAARRRVPVTVRRGGRVVCRYDC